MAKQMTGAEMVVEALKDQGVEMVFGYPGGAVLPIYDAIFHQNKLRHILVRHEQGAGHAAEGYARSTGKVGVLLVTSGPGATNAITALTDALMDSIPLVCITGQVPCASRRGSAAHPARGLLYRLARPAWPGGRRHS
jgi:acetolactate synthase I/II/III large subunit